MQMLTAFQRRDAALASGVMRRAQTYLKEWARENKQVMDDYTVQAIIAKALPDVLTLTPGEEAVASASCSVKWKDSHRAANDMSSNIITHSGLSLPWFLTAMFFLVAFGVAFVAASMGHASYVVLSVLLSVLVGCFAMVGFVVCCYKQTSRQLLGQKSV